ncbi:MAG TPA: MaoC/PaaZ C-terminal domain-containing protein [Acidimicrobiales bacterium]|nr:MaoC/PaaZ C-terminal domain-containing protein [Acidimicrobiales bacterium]
MSSLAPRFEDLEVGDEAPVKTITLSRTDFVAYAGASGDLNPMHHDETVATSAGMPSVFGHGMLSMGILASAVTDWMGAGGLRRMKVRFSKQTWPGETVVTRVVAVAKREEGGRRLVDLECVLANAEGERKVVGEATVELVGGT